MLDLLLLLVQEAGNSNSVQLAGIRKFYIELQASRQGMHVALSAHALLFDRRVYKIT